MKLGRLIRVRAHRRDPDSATCAAEDTDVAHNDGSHVGAAVGITDSNGTALPAPTRPLYKVEGAQARVDSDVIRLLLVTDADDDDIPAVCSPGYDRKTNWVFRIAEASCQYPM